MIKEVGEDGIDTLCFAQKDAKEATAIELAAAEGVEDLLPDSKAFIDWLMEEHAAPIPGESNLNDASLTEADKQKRVSRWIDAKVEKFN